MQKRLTLLLRLLQSSSLGMDTRLRSSGIAALAACGGGLSAGCNVCDSSVQESIVLSLVDAGSGAPVEGTVTFVHDGGAPQTPEESLPGGRYVLASEEVGTFEVTVMAVGYQSTAEAYVVEDDGCHPVTIEDTIALVPAP